MRRLLVAVALGLVVVGGAAARNPRLERLALTPADNAVAAGAVLKIGDLGSGWTGGVQHPDDTTAPDCPFQNYSQFTITGQAQTHFTQNGASVVSRVELYKSRADAAGDFAVDTNPQTAACEGRAIRNGFARQAKGYTVTLASAKRVAAPKVGDRSIAFRIVLTLRRGSQRVPLYIDLIGFTRGRTTGSIVIVAPANPARGAAQLAKVMDARLNGAA